MANFLTDCAKTIGDKILDLIIGEARYLCCYKCIVEDFEKEKEELGAKLKTIDKDIEKERNEGNIIKEDVTFWYKQADKLIKEKTVAKEKCFFGCCPDCLWQYRRGKELAGNVEEARRLKGLDFGPVGQSSKLPGVEYHSSQDFIDFESRNEAYTKLLEALKDENNYMVGLYGMGGTGKTTLVQNVGNEVKKEELFDEVVFTTVSNDPNVRKIQNDIAVPLGLDLKEDDDELKRAKKLCLRLTNGQKILVILDDVWNELNLEDIGIPSRNNHSNCRVLLTSRKLSVCKSMSCKSKVELDLLSEKDAFILFENKIGLKDDSLKTLRKLAQQIANECKRLPVAITVIAKSLKDEPREVWKAALKSLKEFKQLHNIDEELKVYSCFRVSYDNLKDEKAKKLFWLCSVFPEDHEIPLEDLIKFGKGLSLFGEVDSYEEARINMLAAKRKLLDCSLLLLGNHGCVKMHDLVRDAAHWIANYEIQMIMGPKMKPSVEWSTVKYLYFHNMNKFPEGFDGSKLEILISVGIDEGSNHVKLPEAFSERIKNLRVLTLNSGTWRWPNLDMERYIISLNNIQTLCLRNLSLDNISALEKLSLLDTLDLRLCSMDVLPNGIVELKKLRLLSLKSCRIGMNPHKVIGKLSQIQELYFVRNHSNDGSKWEFGKEIFAYFNDKDSLSPNKLQRYFISLSSSEFYSFYQPIDDSVSRGLSIEYFDPSSSNATIKNMVQRAEILHLWNLQGVYSTVTPQLVNEIRGDINELIGLMLHSCSKIECLIDTSNIFPLVGTVFSKLVYLTLVSMDSLKELCFGQPPPDFLENLQNLIINECFQLHGRLLVGNLSLVNLKVIEVNNCPMLTSLFSSSTALSLILLERLEITKCNKLRCIIINEEEKEEGEQILPSESLFPKLETLLIQDCQQMEFICSSCTEWSEMRKDLQVDLKATQLDPTTSSELQSSNLECLYSFEVAQSLVRQSLILRNLKKMDLKNCGEIKSLFTLSSAATMLLVELTIEECHGLKNIIMDVRCDHDCTNYGSPFPRLEELRIKNCSELKYISGQHHPQDQTHNPMICNFPNDSYEAFPSLEFLSLQNCPQLIIESINYLMTCSRSQQLDSTTLKDVEVTVEHLDTSTFMDVKRCKGPKYFLRLKNLMGLEIVECPKLQGLFITSISSSLPKLKYLIIEDCKELEQFIAVDNGNESSSNPVSPQVYFPKLNSLLIRHCNRLKRLFSMSTCHFPMLNYLIITECSELEIFGKSEIIAEDTKVMLPKLKCLVLMQLPKLISMCQGLELLTLEYIVHDCSKDISTSISNAKHVKKILLEDDEVDYDFYLHANNILDPFIDSQEDPTIQDRKEVLVDPPSDLLDSKMIKTKSSSFSAVTLHEASTQDIKETTEQCVEECPTSEKSTIVVIPSTDSESRLLVPLQKGSTHIKEEISKETVGKGPMLEKPVLATSSSELKMSSLHSIEAIIKARYVEAPTLDDAMLTTLSADLAPRKSSKGQLITTPQESLPLELTKKASRSDTTMTHQQPLGEMISDVIAQVNDELLSSLILSKSEVSSTHPTLSDIKETTEQCVEECPTSEKSIIAAIPSMDLKSRPLVPLQKAYTQIIEEISKETVGKGLMLEKPVLATSSSELKMPSLHDEQSKNELILLDQHQLPEEKKTAIEVSPRTYMPSDGSIEAIIKERYVEAPTLDDATLTTLSADLAPRKSSKGQLITTPQESLPLELTMKASRSDTTMTHQQPLGEIISDVIAPVKDELFSSLIPSKPEVSPTNPTPSLVNKEALREPILTGHQEVHGKVEVAIDNDSISKTSISTPSLVSQPFPSIIERPGSSSLLPSKSTHQGKDLVDFRHLLKIDARSASLLEEAIEKYSQLWDWQKNLRPKYCKWGYKSLADMLLFLKSKTPKKMDESSKEEFERIYAELESFGFDKGWLTSIYQRVMDVQVDNMKLKKLDELESRESSLVEELSTVRDEIARIKDDLSKYDTVFNF